MLLSIARACANKETLSAFRKGAVSAPDVHSLIENVRTLKLSHFGQVSSSRAAFSDLPDSLYGLEKEHPLRMAAPQPASFFHPGNLDAVKENGSHELICNMLTVHEPVDKSYALQVFLLPRGCVMPLHDHPGMAVLCKILRGKIDMTTYTLLPPSSPKSNSPKLPKVLNGNNLREVVPQGRYLMREGLGDDSMAMIFPEKGNLHAIRALEHTIFFDLMTPPYAFSTDCTYYRLHRYSAETNKLVGSEAELYTVHSQYPTEATTDKFFVQGFDPSYFQCYSVPWQGVPLFSSSSDYPGL